MNPEQSSLLALGRECIEIEADALRATAESLGDGFLRAIDMLLATRAAERKVIFSGIGKSAHIAHKLVGTFNSTGTPACFLDPVNALHGDLGLCSQHDLAIILSNSGETEELVRLLPLLKRAGVRTLSMTGNAASTLARESDLALTYRVPQEACPLKLAPTASTAAALALGDAVAMVLLEKRGFTREDYARLHPAGNLGRILLDKVTDIMRTGDRFPIAPETCSTHEAIIAMTRAKAGCIALVDAASGKLAGIFTDGDFRRSAIAAPEFLTRPVAEFMTRTPVTVREDCLAVDALKVFETQDIDDLLVVDRENKPVGLIDAQELPRLHLV